MHGRPYFTVTLLRDRAQRLTGADRVVPYARVRALRYKAWRILRAGQLTGCPFELGDDSPGRWGYVSSRLQSTNMAPSIIRGSFFHGKIWKIIAPGLFSRVRRFTDSRSCRTCGTNPVENTEIAVKSF